MYPFILFVHGIKGQLFRINQQRFRNEIFALTRFQISHRGDQSESSFTRNPKISLLSSVCEDFVILTLLSWLSVLIFTSPCSCQPTAAPPTTPAPWFPRMTSSPLQRWKYIHHMWVERAAEQESEERERVRERGHLSVLGPVVLSTSWASYHVTAVAALDSALPRIGWWKHHFSPSCE